MLGEERRPLVVEQGAIRLDGVNDPLARPAELAGELTERRKNRQAHERRLAALPGDSHLGRAGVGLDELPQVGLEQLIGHPEPAARIQQLLGQEEAVSAVKVADRPGRLHQHMERHRRESNRRE